MGSGFKKKILISKFKIKFLSTIRCSNQHELTVGDDLDLMLSNISVVNDLLLNIMFSTYITLSRR